VAELLALRDVPVIVAVCAAMEKNPLLFRIPSSRALPTEVITIAAA
jgi:hypothetical protein